MYKYFHFQCKVSNTSNLSAASTHRFSQCKETMAHPAPCCTISANVRETFLVIPIRGTEWNFLNRLIHYQSLVK